jgi:glycine/D-amino acid oxidase-like deaminating enzyme
VDLKSGYPFWPIKSGLLGVYPSLKEDLRCDVAVIGAGITGALVAYQLVRAGASVVALDRRDAGMGSTSASTALLQYEVDTPLTELKRMVGEADAVRSYLLCLEAIAKLERLAGELDEDCGFERKKSLYLASRRRHRRLLEEEYAARLACGIRLDFLEPDAIEARFSFSAPAALLSHDAAQVDAYRMTHGLLRAASRAGLWVFDRTTVERYEHEPGGVTLITDRGCRVRARKVVIAAGFEAEQYLRRRLVSYRSSYALVSEPTDGVPGWGEGQCLIWESARPYIYLRTTSDGRVLMGGEDDLIDNDHARDRRLPKKVARLTKRFGEMFPDAELEVAYSWAGTFGETADGLPYIGEIDEFPNGYFALGYGGNGITYSMIAAEIIRDLFCGAPNPDASIFRFDR